MHSRDGNEVLNMTEAVRVANTRGVLLNFFPFIFIFWGYYNKIYCIIKKRGVFLRLKRKKIIPRELKQEEQSRKDHGSLKRWTHLTQAPHPCPGAVTSANTESQSSNHPSPPSEGILWGKAERMTFQEHCPCYLENIKGKDI